MSRTRRLARPKISVRRLRAFTAVFFILGFGLVSRLFHLQILNSERFEAQARDSRVFSRTLDPERGQIFIHNGQGKEEYLIATNAVRYSVTADPRLVADPEIAAERLAAVLGKEGEAKDFLRQKLARRDDPYEILARFIDEATAEAVRRLRLSGIMLEKETVRYYPDGSLFAHLTGFVAYKTDSAPGQYGLEGELDGILRGLSGKVGGVKDAVGRLIATSRPDFRRAEPGSSLVLTIDRPTQFVVCGKLAAAVENYGAVSGAAVVVEPKTGKILSLCGAPSFDPNAYNEVADVSVFFNSALQSYEPGSVFKPITMAAAIDSGAVSPKTVYEDTGAIQIGKYVIRNYNDKTYGRQNMVNVLEKSINTGAIFAARALGQDLFAQYVYRFGFGRVTEIPLAGEQSGDVSSVDRRGDIYLATNSFGQGITVTPLQLAMAFSVIANGGLLPEPLLVEAIRHPKGEEILIEPKTARRVITEDTARTLRAMMISVVKNGFGKSSQIAGYYIGGKTGTAQVPDGRGGYGQDTNHTFVGLAPGDDPAFVMVLKLERPKNASEASQTVGRLFKEIASELLDMYGIPKQNT